MYEQHSIIDERLISIYCKLVQLIAVISCSPCTMGNLKTLCHYVCYTSHLENQILFMQISVYIYIYIYIYTYTHTHTHMEGRERVISNSVIIGCMLHTALKPAGNESWEAWIETEREWKARMSEKMLNKQECLQPQWETVPQPLQSAHNRLWERLEDWGGLDRYENKYLLKLCWRLLKVAVFITSHKGCMKNINWQSYS